MIRVDPKNRVLDGRAHWRRRGVDTACFIPLGKLAGRAIYFQMNLRNLFKTQISTKLATVQENVNNFYATKFEGYAASYVLRRPPQILH